MSHTPTAENTFRMAKPLKEDVTRMVTPAEYAKLRYVTRKTVYNWIKAGTVPSCIIAGRTFVRLT